MTTKTTKTTKTPANTSRKSKCHALFVTKGKQAAFLYGRRAGLQESTLRTWFSSWRGELKTAA